MQFYITTILDPHFLFKTQAKGVVNETKVVYRTMKKHKLINISYFAAGMLYSFRLQS